MSHLRWLLLALACLTATAAQAERVAPDTAPLAMVGERRSVEPFDVPRGRQFAGSDARMDKLRRDMTDDRIMLALCRQGFVGCTPGARRFLAIVDEAGAQHGRARLGHVNRAVNLAIAYTSDAAQHGVDDVWSSALDTFASQKGDCEDYAIAKYQALIELGVPAEDLRLVVLRQRTGIWHAVLAARSEDRWLILDNRRLSMMVDTDLRLDQGLASWTLKADPPARG